MFKPTRTNQGFNGKMCGSIANSESRKAKRRRDSIRIKRDSLSRYIASGANDSSLLNFIENAWENGDLDWTERLLGIWHRRHYGSKPAVDLGPLDAVSQKAYDALRDRTSLSHARALSLVRHARVKSPDAFVQFVTGLDADEPCQVKDLLSRLESVYTFKARGYMVPRAVYTLNPKGKIIASQIELFSTPEFILDEEDLGFIYVARPGQTTSDQRRHIFRLASSDSDAAWAGREMRRSLKKRPVRQHAETIQRHSSVPANIYEVLEDCDECVWSEGGSFSSPRAENSERTAPGQASYWSDLLSKIHQAVSRTGPAMDNVSSMARIVSSVVESLGDTHAKVLKAYDDMLNSPHFYTRLLAYLVAGGICVGIVSMVSTTFKKGVVFTSKFILEKLFGSNPGLSSVMDDALSGLDDEVVQSEGSHVIYVPNVVKIFGTIMSLIFVGKAAGFMPTTLQSTAEYARIISDAANAFESVNRARAGWNGIMSSFMEAGCKVVNFFLRFFGMKEIEVRAWSGINFDEYKDEYIRLTMEYQKGLCFEEAQKKKNIDSCLSIMDYLTRLSAPENSLGAKEYRDVIYARQQIAAILRTYGLDAVSASEKRVHPVTLFFCGEPGVGKSAIMPHAARAILKHGIEDKGLRDYLMSLSDPQLIFNKSSSDFFDGEAGHAIYGLNDFAAEAQTKGKNNDASLLLHLADSWPMPLNMANVELKGKKFARPYLIIGTTNMKMLRDVGDVMRHLDAIRRRLDFVYELKINPAFKSGHNKMTTVKGGVECLDMVKYAAYVDSEIAAGRNYPWHVHTLTRLSYTDNGTEEMYDISMVDGLREVAAALRTNMRLHRSGGINVHHDKLVLESDTESEDAYVECEGGYCEAFADLAGYFSRCRRTNNTPRGDYTVGKAACLDVVSTLTQVSKRIQRELKDSTPWYVDAIIGLRRVGEFLAKSTKFIVDLGIGLARDTVSMLATFADVISSYMGPDIIDGFKTIGYSAVAMMLLMYSIITVLSWWMKRKYGTVDHHMIFPHAFDSPTSATIPPDLDLQAFFKIASLLDKGSLKQGDVVSVMGYKWELNEANMAKIREVAREYTHSEGPPNQGPISETVANNLVRFSLLINGVSKVSGYGIRVAGRNVLTCGHIIEVPDDATLVMEPCRPTLGKQYRLQIPGRVASKLHSVRDAANSDLVLVNIPSLPNQCRKSLGLFPTEDAVKKFCGGTVALVDCSTDVMKLICAASCSYSEQVNTVRANMTYSYGANYSFTGIQTEAGYCGLPYVGLDHGQSALFAIHIGAAKSRGNIARAVAVTRSMVQAMLSQLDHLDAPVASEGLPPVEEPIGHFATSGFTYRGKVDPAERLSVSGASSLVKSRVHDSLGPLLGVEVGRYKPAILRPYKGKDPMAIALEKYAGQPMVFDPQAVDRAAKVATHHLGLAHSRVLSFEEAVQGIPGQLKSLPRDKSMGFPKRCYNRRQAFGTDEFTFDTPSALELKRETLEYIARANAGHRDLICFVDFPKDELLKLEKVEACKTRLISSSPIVYNIAYRMLFGDLMVRIESENNRVANGTAIGVNPFGEWQRLYDHLRFYSPNGFAGDFASFDASQQRQILWAVWKRLCSRYDDEYNTARLIMGLELTDSVHLGKIGSGPNEHIYTWIMSLPSGHPSTAVVNSFYNLTLFVLCYHDLTGKNYEDFWADVRICVLGDDNIVAPKAHIADRFNLVTVCGAMQKYGMTYTDAEKTGVLVPLSPLTECTFLKRSFRPADGTVYGPIAISSVEKMCSYYRRTGTTGVSEEEAQTNNLDTLLRELCLYGRTYFESVVPTILQLFSDVYGIEPRVGNNYYDVHSTLSDYVPAYLYAHSAGSR